MATTQRTCEAQREQSQRRPPSEVLAILTVEGRGVAPRVLRRGVTLGPAGTAAALAMPAQRLIVAPEAVPMTEELAAKHQAEQ